MAVARCIQLARRVHPTIEILQLSATTGEGMDAWLHWLDHAMGHGHHHPEEPAPSASEAALRDRVAQLEAELAQARAALSADATL
jgi:hydrogenase nickel incorporation protein HypB